MTPMLTHALLCTLVDMNIGTEHTVKCHRCGRTLRAEASKKRLYGRGCWAIMRAAALAEAVKGFAAAQVEKARELIADGGLIATSRKGVYRAVSSKGDAMYLTHAATCSCPGGLRGRTTCYHSLAVRIVAAGKTA